MVLPFTSEVSWLRADCSFPFFFVCLWNDERLRRDFDQPSESQERAYPGDAFYKQYHLFLIYRGFEGYYEITDDIDVMLSDGRAPNIVGGEENTVFFTREQLAAELCFPVPSLVNQF